MSNLSKNSGTTARSVPVSLGLVSDEIDRVLTKHYGFTDEELDFIPSTGLRAGISYDIKCRMGRAAGDGDGEEE